MGESFRGVTIRPSAVYEPDEPHNMTHSQPGTFTNRSTTLTYCSVSLGRVICEAWASQQGVAVSQLTRWRLTPFITCGTCQQPRLFLPEPDRRMMGGGGEWSAGRGNKEVEVLVVSLTTPTGWLPLPNVWAPNRQQRATSPHTSWGRFVKIWFENVDHMLNQAEDVSRE